jgi:hypothetical protein
VTSSDSRCFALRRTPKHLALLSPGRSQVDASGQVDLLLANPRRRYIMTTLALRREQGGETKWDHACTVRQDHDETHIACTLDKPGAVRVRLFSNAEEFGRYTYFGELEVNNRL